MSEFFDYKGWHLMSSLTVSTVEAQKLFDYITQNNFRDKDKILKSNHRSLVKQIQYHESIYVLKVPREKNKRKWIRFTTLFRGGEAFRNFRAMELLRQNDIPTTVPVLVAEKRHFGMVVDSWIIYHFLEGCSCKGQTEWYPQVIDRLSQMHSKNIIHGDPQLANFLEKGGVIFVIDTSPLSSSPTAYNKVYEFAYLRRMDPDIESFFPAGILSNPLYKFAIQTDKFYRRLASFRRKIKRLLGIRLPQG